MERSFALTLGASLELALLVNHADWSIRAERDGRSKAAALRFMRRGIDHIQHATDVGLYTNLITSAVLLGQPSRADEAKPTLDGHPNSSARQRAPR